MARIMPHRLLSFALIMIAIIAIVGHPSNAALSAAQQAKANAALVGLWTDAKGSYDKVRASKVTVAQIKAALHQGADVNAMTPHGPDIGAGYTPLMLSCMKFNANCAGFLVSKGADVNASTYQPPHQTALMFAAVYGDAKCVRFLVSNGADVNARDGQGLTPLMWVAIAIRGGVDCARYIAPKAAINARDNRGETPLILAASFGRTALVQFLVSMGADVDAKQNDGSTPLALAQKFNHSDIVAILKAAGAK